MAQEAVLFANEAFYQAFAARDIDAMEQLWAKAAPVACIHPGWSPVVGREGVLASWRAILANPASPAIRCRRPQAFLHGDSAFVICYEEIEGAVLIATNLFVREGPGWKMTHHQAGPVAVQSEEEEDEPTEEEGPGGAIH
jgi:SnoaL-like domain